jgi:hypothetical protein
MIGIFSLGVAIEFAQVFVYANRLEPEDMRDDGYGIMIVYGIWLAAKVVERRSSRNTTA